MELLIIILIFVIGFKDCNGQNYKNELKDIKYELSKIANRLENLISKK